MAQDFNFCKNDGEMLLNLVTLIIAQTGVDQSK